MADDDQRAVVGSQPGFDGLDVDMIGGLVEDQ